MDFLDSRYTLRGNETIGLHQRKKRSNSRRSLMLRPRIRLEFDENESVCIVMIFPKTLHSIRQNFCDDVDSITPSAIKTPV